MLVLILIDVQHSQKALFSFEKGSNGQNHSSSCSDHPISPSKISNPPTPYRYLENPATPLKVTATTQVFFAIK